MSHEPYTTTTSQRVYASMTERRERYASLERLPSTPDTTWNVARCQDTHCHVLYVWPRGLASLEDGATLRCVRCGAPLARTTREARGAWSLYPLEDLAAAYGRALERQDAAAASDAEYLAALEASGTTSADGLAYARQLRTETRATMRKPLEAKLRKLRKAMAAEAAKLAEAAAVREAVDAETDAEYVAMASTMRLPQPEATEPEHHTDAEPATPAQAVLLAALEAGTAKLVPSTEAVEAAKAAAAETAAKLRAEHEAARTERVHASDAYRASRTPEDDAKTLERVQAADYALRQTRAALEAAGVLPQPRVHTYASTSEAYNRSQCDDAVQDGDVLRVPSEDAAAVMVSAWPTAATEATAGEAFHVLADGEDWSALPAVLDGGRTDYAESAAVMAAELAEDATLRTLAADLAAKPLEASALVAPEDVPTLAAKLVPGVLVEHVESGARGTVAGTPAPQRSAGNALYVRVRWQHEYAREAGALVAIRRLRIVEDGSSTAKLVEPQPEAPQPEAVESVRVYAEAAERREARAAVYGTEATEDVLPLAHAMAAAWSHAGGQPEDMPSDAGAVLRALDARMLETAGRLRYARMATARGNLAASMDALEAALASARASEAGSLDESSEAVTEPHTASEAMPAPGLSGLGWTELADGDEDAERCRGCGCRADWHDAMDGACPEDTEAPHPYSMAADALEDEDTPEAVETAKLHALAAAAVEATDWSMSALEDVSALVLDYREATAAAYGADAREAAKRTREAIRHALADMDGATYALVPDATLRLAGMPYVERQCSGTEDGWLYYVLQDAERVEDAGGWTDAEPAWLEAADLARLAMLDDAERHAVDALRSAMQGSAEDAYGLAILVLEPSGWHVLEYREATASDGWTPERMRTSALVEYAEHAAKLVDVDGLVWTLAGSEDVPARSAALATVDALEATAAKLADCEAVCQRLRVELADMASRTLPDFRSADGSALVCLPGAVLPDGRGSVVVAASASSAHVWHVLAMRPGWHAADTYYVATYARPSSCDTPQRTAWHDTLAAALADYASRTEAV